MNQAPRAEPYQISAHKATLYAELERLGRASQEEDAGLLDTKFAEGAISALRWLLNEGPAPTTAMGWSEHA